MTTSIKRNRQDWYFTFGSGHEQSGRYVKIYGVFEEARAEMVRRYGTKWSMQYASAEDAGIQQWNLTELK